MVAKSIIGETVLLLSATVNPNSMANSIQDPRRRLEDYKAVFRHYLHNDPDLSRLLFVENSNWPLDELVELSRENPHGKQVEFLSLDANDFPREFGKGYGEHLLISLALERSALVREATYVAKMTGRHYLMNLADILRRSLGPLELLCDFRDHSLYDWLGLPLCGHHCDTRFIVFTPQFFATRLRELPAGHTSGEFSLEGNYYHAIKPLDDGTSVRCRFPVEPRYRGLAGHGGKNYSGAVEFLKQSIRGTTRQVCPWLRI